MRLRSAAAAVLTAALMTVSTAHAADLGDLELLPADGKVVVQIDVAALMGTSLVSDLLKQAKMNPQTKASFDKVKTEFGLDPEKDIERVTMMMSTTAGDKALMVVNTKVPYDTILAGAKKQDTQLKAASHAGKSYHVDNGTAMAAVGKRIVIGDEALVKKALETSKAQSLASNKAIMALAKSASKDKGQIWFTAILPNDPAGKMIDPALKGVQMVKGNLDLAKGLTARVDLGAGTDAQAKTIADALNAQLEKAKAEQAQNPMAAAMGLGAVMNNLKATANGKAVNIGLKLTEAQVNQLKAMAQMMVGMAAMQAGSQGGTVAPPPGQKNAPVKGK